MSGFLNLTEQELLYLVATFNGINCIPETFIANVYDAYEFPQGVDEPEKASFINKLKKYSLQEISELHSRVINFWNTPTNYIPNTQKRMIEVGLLNVETVFIN